MAQLASSALDKVSDTLSNTPVKEGETTRSVETQTAKIPSLGYLGLAVGSMAISAGLAIFSRRKDLANFVGLWAPSFMLIGIYNKLVKLEHSSEDRNFGSSSTSSNRSSGNLSNSSRKSASR